MKKKTYKIGAALLLLALLAGGFYLTETRNDKTGDKGWVSYHWAHKGTGGSQAGSKETDNESGITEDNTVVASTTTTHSRYTRKVKHSKTSVRTITNSEDVVANNRMNHNTELSKEIAADTANVYLGKLPLVQTKIVEVKKEQKKFHLPENIFGLEIGYNENYMSNSHVANMQTSNINVGLLFNIGMGNHFAIQPGIKYINKGNKLQSETDVETREKLSLHYLEVPVNFVYKFGKVGNVRFMVGAGPYVAYLAGAKDKFHTITFSDASDVLPSTPQYSTNNINNLDWGLGGFIGCQSPDGLFAKVGGELGMMDIMKNQNGTYSNRNNNISLSVGYIFGGK